MTIRAVQKLLRNSQSTIAAAGGQANEPDADQPDSARPSVLFPLVKQSKAMRDFFDLVVQTARDNTFVAVSGSKGDFLEADALFAACAQNLDCLRPAVVKPGQERETLNQIFSQRTDALCFVCGRQIPAGIQQALADTCMPTHVKLVMTLTATLKNYPDACTLRPDFLRRNTGVTLPWPAWSERQEDHDQLMDYAYAVLTSTRTPSQPLTPALRDKYKNTPWRSVGHMVRAMTQLFTQQSNLTDS